MEKNCIKEPVRPTIMGLAVGETVSFPRERTSVVRSTISTLNLEGKMYCTSRVNRPNGTVDVKRIS